MACMEDTVVSAAGMRERVERVEQVVRSQIGTWGS